MAVRDLDRELIVATRNGNLDLVKELVEKDKANVNCQGAFGWTPLHVACNRKHVDVAAYLLGKGADQTIATVEGELPHHLLFTSGDLDLDLYMILFKAARSKGHQFTYARRKDGASPLHIACERGNFDVAEVLLKEGADYTQKSANGTNPLHAAVESGGLSVVRLMLSLGDYDCNAMSLTQRTSDNFTPFMIACSKNNIPIGELLCKKFTKTDHLQLKSTTNCTVLHCACSISDEESALWWAKIAIDSGVFVDGCRDDNCTALHLVVQAGMTKLASMLLAAGASANIKRNDGETALHLALKKSPELVWLILNKCSHLDLGLQNSDGSTPLLLACDYGDMKLVEYLVKAYPNAVNVCRLDGLTPLGVATSRGHREMAQLLLDCKADVNCCIASTKETVLHLVLEPSSTTICGRKWLRRPEWAMTFLESAGSTAIYVNAKRLDGSTPLILACTYADMPVVKRLLEVGADPSLTREDGLCPLLIAFEKNHQQMAQLLLAAGACITTPSKKRGGQTVLMTSLQRGDKEWVRMLMPNVKPSDCVFQSDDGSTLIHYCSEGYPDEDVWNQILELTKDINACRGDRCTPLHLVAQRGDLNRARILIQKGANVTAQAHHKLTPLHYACRGGHATMAKLLISAGANTESVSEPLAVDESEATPVTFAREAGNMRLVRMLMDPLRSSLAVMLRKVTINPQLEEDKEETQEASGTEIAEPVPKRLRGACSICMEEDTDLLALSRCGHAFCLSCLDGWFTANYNGYTHARCPFKGCSMLASYYDLKACLSNPSLYEEQMVRRAIMDIPEFRWCPKCQMGGIVPCDDAICCACGYNFCARCMLEKHDGSCELYFQNLMETQRSKKREVRRMAELKASSEWIKEFTRPCPGCNCSIKRSGGCSHITCRNCQYQWCWLCGGKYIGLYTFGNECPCKKP